MALQMPGKRVSTSSAATAGPAPDPPPIAALGWLAGGAVLAFAASLIGTTVLGLQHDLYYLLYFTVVLAYLARFAVRPAVRWRQVLRRNVWWSLGIGVLVGLAVVRQVLGQPATPHPAGAYSWFELVWRGLVYGAVDALVLAVFPAVVADVVLSGDRRGPARKAAYAGLVLLFSLVVSTTYHLGYSTYRGDQLAKPVIGTVMWDLPAVFTGNPAGALIAHPAVHTAAVVHQYYGGERTNQLLPPELTSDYPDRPGGVAALAVAAGWLVLTGAVLAHRSSRRRSPVPPPSR